MGIETILFILGLILVATVWGLARKNRRDSSDHDTTPPRLSER